MNANSRKAIDEYERSQKERKERIKAIPSFWRRLWARIVFWLLFPWRWCWANFRDPMTMIVFCVWLTLLSSEVWVSYLMALMTWGTEASKWWLAVANSCWIWWLLPMPESNFMIYCIGLTILTKSIINRIKEGKHGRKKDIGEDKGVETRP